MATEQPNPPKVVLWTNWITLIGLLWVGMGLLLLVTFWLFMALAPEHSQTDYVNIIGFLVLPGILATGLVLCPLGIMIRRFRYRRYGVARQLSVRSAVSFLAISFFVMLPVMGVSGYRGYHYTESTEFCGSCHQVMEPQYTTYHQSAHARVTCAECHIGSGASPFVKSKLSGLRQVVAVATNSYPRPIPPAIHSLRPARETCEECHWPQRFYGSVLKPIVRYSPDEQNTRREFRMLLKVGGQNEHLGRSEGIHMHMIGRVEYVATDAELQTIPWVKYTRDDGTATIYRSDGEPMNAAPPAGTHRVLDCMDCHNRAAHGFLSPEDSVDAALNVHQLPDDLPYIKREGVAALAEPYADKAGALSGIAQRITSYYQANYPELASARQGDIARAVSTLQTLYATNLFPYMKANWRTYPDNIGHMFSPGCFRCHNGLHVNGQGERITVECSACHSFLNPVDGSDMIRQGNFEHQMKIHELWKGLGPHENLRCDQCHTGDGGAWGKPFYTASACGDCHSSGRWLEMKDAVLFRNPSTQPTTRP